MGQYAAEHSGVVEEPPLGVEECVDGLLRQMDGATKEETSGRFLGYNGEELPW
jgi:norsolorinic acid ketoreductase